MAQTRVQEIDFLSSYFTNESFFFEASDLAIPTDAKKKKNTRRSPGPFLSLNYGRSVIFHSRTSSYEEEIRRFFSDKLNSGSP